jgi:hypothetical protein
MKGRARDGARELPTTVGIVSYPRGFHFHNTERQSIGDHFPHGILTGLPTPFKKCVAFIGRLVWAPCPQTGDDPTRVVDADCEKYGVGTALERIHIERLFDSVLAVIFTRTTNIVDPQRSFDRRMCEHNRALAVGIPTAGTPLEADNAAALGITSGNGHSCAFLGLPANNGVAVRDKYLAAGYSDSS